MSRPIALLLLLLLMPATAAAQTVELSESQRAYNDKGVAAIREGNYAAAITSFESSLTLGEANITYLNLGRAYQRAGQCLPAKEAYAKVAAAPPVTAPTAAEILAVLEKYSSELPELCPAMLEIACEDPETQISVDSRPPEPCGGGFMVQALPGEHTIRATLGARVLDEKVTPGEGEALAVSIAFPEEAIEAPQEVAVAPVESATVNEPARTRPLRTAGLIVGALGAAGLTTAVISDLTYVRGAVRPCTPKRADGDPVCDGIVREDARSARRTNTIVLSVGGGLAVAGVILYFVGGSPESGVSLQYDHGPGIAYMTRF